MIDEPGLDDLAAEYAQVKAHIAELGWAVPGTISQRYTICTSRGCRCRADPPQRHGPYWQYTRTLGGKTVTRRITEAQAEHYREWIANRRRLDDLTADMDRISRQAIETILAAPPSQDPPTGTDPVT